MPNEPWHIVQFVVTVIFIIMLTAWATDSFKK